MTDLDQIGTYRASGPQEAFTEIVTHYSGMVYGVCLRILKDPSDAEDAMQATFRSMEHFARFCEIDSSQAMRAALESF
jgi:DNA-directed RNA polymerase specialized sigma24 family protein